MSNLTIGANAFVRMLRRVLGICPPDERVNSKVMIRASAGMLELAMLNFRVLAWGKIPASCNDSFVLYVPADELHDSVSLLREADTLHISTDETSVSVWQSAPAGDATIRCPKLTAYKAGPTFEKTLAREDCSYASVLCANSALKRVIRQLTPSARITDVFYGSQGLCLRTELLFGTIQNIQVPAIQHTGATGDVRLVLENLRLISALCSVGTVKFSFPKSGALFGADIGGGLQIFAQTAKPKGNS